MQKMEQWLQELCNQFLEMTRARQLPFDQVWQISPKISKGEAYRGLPWLMLDYPRYFGKEGHLSIRVFFWWGNFIAIYLHSSGVYGSKLMHLPAYWKGWEHGNVQDPYCFEEKSSNLVLQGESAYFRAAKRYSLAVDYEDTAAHLKADYNYLVEVITRLGD